VIDVAVVYSSREDGMKFSACSEDPEVHTEELVREGLGNIGN